MLVDFTCIVISTAGQVPPSPQPDSRLRWRKDQTQWRQERDRDGERVKAFSEPDFLVLGNLASEVSMVTLDMLEIVIRVRNYFVQLIDARHLVSLWNFGLIYR